jgi:hypothetical protein
MALLVLKPMRARLRAASAVAAPAPAGIVGAAGVKDVP